MEMGPQGLSYKYLPVGINNSFERSVKKGLGGGEREEEVEERKTKAAYSLSEKEVESSSCWGSYYCLSHSP